MENHMKIWEKNKLIITSTAQQYGVHIDKVKNMMEWVFITPYTPLKSPS
jgi:hypothetical protein